MLDEAAVAVVVVCPSLEALEREEDGDGEGSVSMWRDMDEEGATEEELDTVALGEGAGVDKALD